MDHAYKSCTNPVLWVRLFPLIGFGERVETFGNCNSTGKPRNKCLDQDHTVPDNILSRGTYGTRSVSHSLLRIKSEFIRRSVNRGLEISAPKASSMSKVADSQELYALQAYFGTLELFTCMSYGSRRNVFLQCMALHAPL